MRPPRSLKRCAFLTLDERGGWFIDDELAVEPLAQLGCEVSTVSWRQTDTPWSHFDAVIIRSTWDYWDHTDQFLAVLEEINASTRLANSLQLVHWNLAKSYLRDMEQQGVGIVPSLWSHSLGDANLDDLCDRLHCDEIVIKPLVGANGVDTFRLARGEDDEQLAELVPLFRNRELMVQRFMPSILNEGEYSLFYFNGEYSHAILKVPQKGEFRSQEERGADIQSARPETRLLQRGAQALATIHPTPLYARIDFVRCDVHPLAASNLEGHDFGADDFVVMECELIEPSLYLRTDPRAPGRFAQAVMDWFEAGQTHQR